MPDPVTVAALAASQAKVKDLEDKLRVLAKTVEEKDVQIGKLQKELRESKKFWRWK